LHSVAAAVTSAYASLRFALPYIDVIDVPEPRRRTNRHAATVRILELEDEHEHRCDDDRDRCGHRHVRTPVLYTKDATQRDDDDGAPLRLASIRRNRASWS